MSWVRLTGESGTGKSTVAREVAFRLNAISTNHAETEKSIIDKNSDLIAKLINYDVKLTAIYIGPRFSPNLHHNYKTSPEWILDILDLNLNKDTLSQGETQRLVLIEALSHNPDYLILDEALSGVSIDHELEILQRLKLHSKLDLLYITHRNNKSIDEMFDYIYQIK